MMVYFYTFLVALFMSIVLIPPISRLAVTIGIFDHANERKMHHGDIPRLGGIAIFFAFFLAALLFFHFDQQTRGFLVGGVIVFLTGLADDLVGLSPRKKLVGQFLAALAVVLMGNNTIDTLGNIVGFGDLNLGLLAVPFSVFCVVGVMNSINLIDGLDGLAGGVTAIACIAFVWLGYLTNNYFVLFIAAALLGGVLGFLKYNTHPASIFMGDAGSLFLGYCMATAAIALVNGSDGRISVVTPLVVLAVPIADTIFVMTRRKMTGNGIFSADRTHIHHRLVALGFGHGATVNIVYGMAYFLAIFAVFSRNVEDYLLLMLLLVLLFVFVAINKMVLPFVSAYITATKEVREKGSASVCSRRKVTYIGILRRSIKYLLLLTLLLSVAVDADVTSESAVVAASLMALISILIFMTQDWGNVFLRFVLYCTAAYICFYIESGASGQEIAGFDLSAISNGLFLLLLGAITLKVILRKRSRIIIHNPLESLALFPVVSIPLLPGPFITEFHLFGLGAKSIVIFIGYKIVLMKRSSRNRKIIFATILALGAVVVRRLLNGV